MSSFSVVSFFSLLRFRKRSLVVLSEECFLVPVPGRKGMVLGIVALVFVLRRRPLIVSFQQFSRSKTRERHKVMVQRIFPCYIGGPI